MIGGGTVNLTNGGGGLERSGTGIVSVVGFGTSLFLGRLERCEFLDLEFLCLFI
jgi:hypothetical protein